ncbi:type II toxin-antitoxin system VapC family toxin [Dyadobacter arcticus]|uniref:Nucleic acid-binding protein n=1 Tax=Dyadobacter arcticus TaxID=1078754 RepID=A0ABX0USA1_9BACT|nr:type II toxin-antitoxin system VapC family toxin [Dyadobacter arcticus]NIJ54630.1 putative nucleic acid-binding protein [Dyadobacter arcticus]
MNLFFDTSALVKYYLPEAGSDKVDQLIGSTENHVWLSELLKTEFYSALFRRFRTGELSAIQIQSAINGFEISIQQFHIQPLNSLVLHESEKLLKTEGRKYPIRTLDALHFCSFRLLADSTWAFVTADTPFAGFVSGLGYHVVNPLTS